MTHFVPHSKYTLFLAPQENNCCFAKTISKT